MSGSGPTIGTDVSTEGVSSFLTVYLGLLFTYYSEVTVL